tara:strand:- start:474 stop:653 length:180 start_codon:yes stop_codon:yes gene_type:complete
MQNNIKFNKTQLEIIAYFLSLDVDEMQNQRIKKETINILAKLQEIKIFGHIPQNTFGDE